MSYSNSQLFRRHPTSFALRVLREHLGILPTEISAASSGCFQLGTGYDILGDRFKEGAEVFQFGEPIAGRLGIRSVANAVKIYLTSIWPLENLLYTLPILCRVPPGVQINFLSDTDTFMEDFRDLPRYIGRRFDMLELNSPHLINPALFTAKPRPGMNLAGSGSERDTLSFLLELRYTS